MALITGTTVRPEPVPDALWFEATAGRVLEKVFRELSERSESNNFVILTASLQDFARTMGESFSVAEAFNIFKAVLPELRRQSHRRT